MTVSKSILGVISGQKMTNSACTSPSLPSQGGKSTMILAHSSASSHIFSFLVSAGFPFYYKLHSFLLVVLS